MKPDLQFELNLKQLKIMEPIFNKVDISVPIEERGMIIAQIENYGTVYVAYVDSEKADQLINIITPKTEAA
jgi:phosphoribosylaminoimidazole (AIR) synthetase